jgi:hypothetical protein
MKLIIAGKRTFKLDITTIQNLIDIIIPDDLPLPNEIVSGTAKGIDRSGENWAIFQGIPIKRFKPDWDKFGKAAGPKRNQEMAKYGDALLLIWDGQSKGSSSMKKEMQKLKKPIYEIIIKSN